MAAKNDVPTSLNAGTVSGLIDIPKETEFVPEWPAKVQDCLVPVFDTGVFVTELAKNDLLPKKLTGLTEQDLEDAKRNPETLLQKANEQAPDQLSEGTYRGTQLALTKVYDIIEKKYDFPYCQKTKLTFLDIRASWRQPTLSLRYPQILQWARCESCTFSQIQKTTTTHHISTLRQTSLHQMPIQEGNKSRLFVSSLGLRLQVKANFYRTR